MGLVPTGHTFTVGSEACIGCHQDTVHTRDSIVRLTGQVEGVPEVDTETLEQQISQQSMAIQDLEAAEFSAALYWPGARRNRWIDYWWCSSLGGKPAYQYC